jgi:hypothetical protein
VCAHSNYNEITKFVASRDGTDTDSSLSILLHFRSKNSKTVIASWPNSMTSHPNFSFPTNCSKPTCADSAILVMATCHESYFLPKRSSSSVLLLSRKNFAMMTMTVAAMNYYNDNDGGGNEYDNDNDDNDH